MDSMSDELKETIIREHPGGIWLVLAQEYPPDVVTADDLLCGRSLRFHCPAQLNRCVGERYALGRMYTWPRQSLRLSQRARV
jgi:hypothetical protein